MAISNHNLASNTHTNADLLIRFFVLKRYEPEHWSVITKINVTLAKYFTYPDLEFSALRRQNFVYIGGIMAKRGIILVLVIWAFVVILKLAGGLTHVLTLALIALVLAGLIQPGQRGGNRRRF